MAEERVEKESLEALAERIAQCANEADARIIEAAHLIREARARVESGEIGEVKWYAWARKNIGLSTTRLWELQHIAEADDPRQELERQRKLIRERAEKHREKKKAEQPAPLRNGGDKPVEATSKLGKAEHERGKISPEHGEISHMKPKAAAPLRNGGAQIRANAEIEKDRQRLIDWAQAAPLEQIQEVLSFIERFEAAEADSHLVEPAAPAAA